jgi:hypothetical protein
LGGGTERGEEGGHGDVLTTGGDEGRRTEFGEGRIGCGAWRLVRVPAMKTPLWSSGYRQVLGGRGSSSRVSGSQRLSPMASSSSESERWCSEAPAARATAVLAAGRRR